MSELTKVTCDCAECTPELSANPWSAELQRIARFVNEHAPAGRAVLLQGCVRFGVAYTVCRGEEASYAGIEWFRVTTMREARAALGY
jgi:hypothetical protein